MATESLFNSLRKSNEDGGSTYLENYFTKIVVYLFQTSPKILLTWLKRIDLIEDTTPYEIRDVSPQAPYNCHPHFPNHLTKRCRVDIVIELSCGTDRDLIFIESKIDSQEHNDQLRRYVEHLYSQPGVRNKILLYVTSGREEKNKNQVLENIPESAVRFEQKRWHTLQQILQAQPKNPLLDEIIIFMAENKMGLDNKLTQEIDRVDLSGVNLSNTILSGVILSKTNLSNVNLSNANLSGANLSKANLRGANLTGANLDGADLSEADLCGTDLRDIRNLQKAKLKQANFSGANLSGAELQAVDLSMCNLSKTNLSKTNLRQANLSETDLQETDLSGADLQGVNFSKCNLLWADLHGADLSCSNLSEANLYSAKLQGANLHEANLYGADLRGAKLDRADLSNANMHKINYNGLTIWPEGFNPPADTEMK